MSQRQAETKSRRESKSEVESDADGTVDDALTDSLDVRDAKSGDASEGSPKTVPPSAVELWEAFLDGEREFRDDFTAMDSFRSFIANSKRFYAYQLGRYSRRQSTTSEVDVLAEASTVLLAMSLDKRMTARVLLQALDFGCDINAVDRDTNESIIHRIARNANVEALQCLLSTCALSLQCDVQTKRRETPLLLACRSTELMGTSISRAEDCVRLLLNRDDICLRIDVPDESDRSALCHTVRLEHWKLCRMLLQEHASAWLSLPSLPPQYFPELKRLVNAHSKMSDLLKAARQSPSLSKFVCVDEIDEMFVDYRESVAPLWLRVMRDGAAAVIRGMIAFRIREELRDQKYEDLSAVTLQNDNASFLVTLQQRKELEQQQEQDVQRQFAKDLAKRDQFSAQRKHEKAEALRERRDRKEQKEWDQRRDKVQSRLDDQFEVKIRGLFV